MGYGVPAAVAAKLVLPERIVVAMAGDGDFLMTGQELARGAVRGPIIVLVVNNGMYGTIRMHQERQYPGRVSGTDLVNPDFAALAEAFGAHGAIVERTQDFAPAFETALACGRPALIELRVDPEALTPPDPDRDQGTGAGELLRIVGSSGPETASRRRRQHGEVLREHGERRLPGRGLGAHPGFQRPRNLAQWARVDERDRGRQSRRPGRRHPQLHADGQHAHREQLVTHSDLDGSYTYDFQQTPFDVDNDCATIRVTPITDGGDRDRDQQEHWTDFFASQIFQGGFDALKSDFA